MKGLTIHQPYATLIAAGVKHIETRSWATDYRGLVLIHAGKRWDEEVSGECATAQAFVEEDVGIPGSLEVLWPVLCDWKRTLGAGLAIANLVDCRAMEEAPNAIEESWGGFGPGRFGWVFEEIRPLAMPVPCRGAQGLWDVPEDVLGQVEDAALMWERGEVPTPAEEEAPATVPISSRAVEADPRWGDVFRLRQEIRVADLVYVGLKTETKEAKEHTEYLRSKLLHLIDEIQRGEHQPSLFDGVAAHASADTDDSDEDATVEQDWRETPLSELVLLGLPESVVAKFASAGIETLGAISDYVEPTAGGYQKQLTDIPGIGASAVEKFYAAQEKFFEGRTKAELAAAAESATEAEESEPPEELEQSA